MSEVIEVTEMGVLFQSLNITKYLPKTTEKLRNPKYNLFLELEESRKMSCDLRGKTSLFKSSCFNYDSDCTHDGQVMAKVHYRHLDIFTTVSSLRGCPYSISISNENNNIDFAVNEFSDVCQKMNRIIRCLLGDCECHPCFFDDQIVDIWGGCNAIIFFNKER